MKLLFIGGGHMARALIAGVVRNGGAQIVVAERNEEKRQGLAADFGVKTLPQAPAQTNADAVVLAMRPPQARAACEQLRPGAALTVSVVAGLRVANLQKWLGGGARVARAMPNTPAQLATGMTFFYAPPPVAAADKKLMEAIFNGVGKTAWLPQEGQLSAATALSGSGPAYFYYFADAMRRAAEELGLPPQVAEAAAAQTAKGAAAMLAAGDKTAAELCAAVAVRGGTTEQALAVFERRALPQTVAQAMRACHAKAEEIGDALAAKDKDEA